MLSYTYSSNSYIYIEFRRQNQARGDFLVISHFVQKEIPRLSSDLALDEVESLVAVDVDVLLVVVGVVAVAAVWVLRVAVALDDAAIGGRAGEALGTSGKLI